MILAIYFWLLLGVFALYVVIATYREIKFKSEIKRMHDNSVRLYNISEAKESEWKAINAGHKQEIETIRESRRKLAVSIQRLKILVLNLRKRQITFVRGITWFKNPETDIRVLKVQAREQLAIDLENGGAIEYLISENPRPDIDQTEITVKARIKTLNMK